MQPYSVRFMSGRGTNRHETFTVPEGRRAVVRSVFYQSFSTLAGAIALDVHGLTLVYDENLESGKLVTLEVRLTAYERETIVFTIVAPDVSYAIDGFMFSDVDGTPDDADNVITPAAIVGGLPAAAQAPAA